MILLFFCRFGHHNELQIWLFAVLRNSFYNKMSENCLTNDNFVHYIPIRSHYREVPRWGVSSFSSFLPHEKNIFFKFFKKKKILTSPNATFLGRRYNIINFNFLIFSPWKHEKTSLKLLIIAPTLVEQDTIDDVSYPKKKNNFLRKKNLFFNFILCNFFGPTLQYY